LETDELARSNLANRRWRPKDDYAGTNCQRTYFYNTDSTTFVDDEYEDPVCRKEYTNLGDSSLQLSHHQRSCSAWCTARKAMSSLTFLTSTQMSTMVQRQPRHDDIVISKWQLNTTCAIKLFDRQAACGWFYSNCAS